MNETYELHIAGLTRHLQLHRVNEHLQIAGFIMLGDTELVEECAKVLVTKLPADIDYLICLAHFMLLNYDQGRQHIIR